MSHPARIPAAALLSLALLAGACATPTPPRDGRAEPAAAWSSLASASRDALGDPAVWGSLAAAAALRIDDADRRVSDELRAETPLFGSAAAANAASDDWRSVTSLAMAGSALAVPVETLDARVGGNGALLLADWLAVQSTRWLTAGLKSATARERPNGRDDKSLPSGHASRAAVQAALAASNLRRTPMPAGWRDTLTWTVHGAAALTGWARVEAGLHYPSDVLAGWALGRYLGRLAEGLIFDGSAGVILQGVVEPDRVFVGARIPLR